MSSKLQVNVIGKGYFFQPVGLEFSNYTTHIPASISVRCAMACRTPGRRTCSRRLSGSTATSLPLRCSEYTCQTRDRRASAGCWETQRLPCTLEHCPWDHLPPRWIPRGSRSRSLLEMPGDVLYTWIQGVANDDISDISQCFLKAEVMTMMV